MRKVMIFGIFDGVHGNHSAFISEAQSHGDDVIAVVAQDHIVKRILGREPSVNFIQRFDELKKFDKIGEVVIGDAELATWRIVERYRPEVVAFASDQKLLHDDLDGNLDKLSYHPQIITLKTFEKNN